MIKQKVEEIKNKIEETQMLEKEIKRLINIIRFLFSISLVLAALSDASLIMMPNVRNAIAFSVSAICLVICSICLGKSNSDGEHLLQDIKQLKNKQTTMISRKELQKMDRMQ